MGADLLVNLVEIERGRPPDWAAARHYLDRRSDDELAVAIAVNSGEDGDNVDPEDMKEYLFGARKRCEDAITNCLGGWLDQRRELVKVCLAATDMLVTAEMSSGDVSEAHDDIALFILSGAAFAAGFIVHDAHYKRVACWLECSSAQQIVEHHAAYTDCLMNEPAAKDYDGAEDWGERLAELEEEIVTDLAPIAIALGVIGFKAGTPVPEQTLPDTQEGRVAVWFDQNVAQQIVNDHAAYVDHGIHEPREVDAMGAWNDEQQALEDKLVSDMVDVADALDNAGLKPESVLEDEYEDEDENDEDNKDDED